MDDKEVGRMWDENAEVWTKLSRMGCNVYRDLFNTPAFLSILPDIRGMKGLDVGCGEGADTREFAKRGGKMTAVDISERFIRHAREKEAEEPLGIIYEVASAWNLPFPDASFDFATATMSLMDIPEPERAVGEIHRVLKNRGFLQFSITHPCFDLPRRKWVDDPEGAHTALEVSDYFGASEGHIEEWIFGFTPPDLKSRLRKFRVPRFQKTLSEWLNMLIDAGFIIERVHEPTATDEAIRKQPHLEDTRIIAHFLFVRCRKR